MKTTAKLTLLLFVAVASTAAASEDEEGRVLTIAGLAKGECPRLVQLGEDGPEILGLGSYAYLGVETTALTPELRRHFGVPDDAGVLLGRVEEGSPAAAAGLAVGDVLTRFDGEDVTSGGRLARLVRRYEKGDQVPLEYWRDGKAATATAVLGERERCGFDVSRILDLEHLPAIRLEDLPHVDPEDLPDFGRLMEIHEIDGRALEKGAEALRRALESQDWQRHVERLRDVDLSDVEERLREAMERLDELEKEIRSEKERIRSEHDDDVD